MTGPDADTANFAERIAGEVPVIAKFQTEACVICRKLDPMLAAVAKRLDGRLGVVDVDAEESPDLAERYHIRGVPTLILFKAGQEVDRKAGFLTASALREWLAPHI
ncbi:MAG: thioredoxin family protein [Alphaproteobacteria bacterium]|jgi:thioredoxin-like negative regulator of GroEL|nr:thioredoxin family protein [Alphaproteobacteria bacterium]